MNSQLNTPQDDLEFFSASNSLSKAGEEEVKPSSLSTSALTTPQDDLTFFGSSPSSTPIVPEPKVKKSFKELKPIYDLAAQAESGVGESDILGMVKKGVKSFFTPTPTPASVTTSKPVTETPVADVVAKMGGLDLTEMSKPPKPLAIPKTQKFTDTMGQMFRDVPTTGGMVTFTDPEFQALHEDEIANVLAGPIDTGNQVVDTAASFARFPISMLYGMAYQLPKDFMNILTPYTEFISGNTSINESGQVVSKATGQPLLTAKGAPIDPAQFPLQLRSDIADFTSKTSEEMFAAPVARVLRMSLYMLGNIEKEMGLPVTPIPDEIFKADLEAIKGDSAAVTLGPILAGAGMHGLIKELKVPGKKNTLGTATSTKPTSELPEGMRYIDEPGTFEVAMRTAKEVEVLKAQQVAPPNAIPIQPPINLSAPMGNIVQAPIAPTRNQPEGTTIPRANPSGGKVAPVVPDQTGRAREVYLAHTPKTNPVNYYPIDKAVRNWENRNFSRWRLREEAKNPTPLKPEVAEETPKPSNLEKIKKSLSKNPTIAKEDPGVFDVFNEGDFIDPSLEISNLVEGDKVSGLTAQLIEKNRQEKLKGEGGRGTVVERPTEPKVPKDWSPRPRGPEVKELFEEEKILDSKGKPVKNPTKKALNNFFYDGETFKLRDEFFSHPEIDSELAANPELLVLKRLHEVNAWMNGDARVDINDVRAKLGMIEDNVNAFGTILEKYKEPEFVELAKEVDPEKLVELKADEAGEFRQLVKDIASYSRKAKRGNSILYSGKLESEIGKLILKTYRSKYQEVIKTFPEIIDPSQLEGRLKNLGVKEEELAYSGVRTIIDNAKSGGIKLTKRDLLELGSDPTYRLEENLRLGDETAWKRDNLRSKGDAFNYSELTLSMPDSTPNVEGHRSHSYPEPNIIGWTRFDERILSSGERALHIDEFQSDLHRKDTVYGKTLGNAEIQKVIDEINTLHAKIEENAEARRFRQALLIGKNYYRRLTAQLDFNDAKYRKLYTEFSVTPKKSLEVELDKILKDNDRIRAERSESYEKDLKEFTVKHERLREELDAKVYERDNMLETVMEQSPDLPYKKTWPILLFKRLLKEAVVRGDEAITWTTGTQQNKRYSLTQIADTLNFRSTDRAYALETNGAAGRNFYNIADKKELTSYVGNEKATELFKQLEEGKEIAHMEIAEFEVGEKNKIPLYDSVITNQIKDYVKKLGGIVDKDNILIQDKKVPKKDTRWQVKDLRDKPDVEGESCWIEKVDPVTNVVLDVRVIPEGIEITSKSLELYKELLSYNYDMFRVERNTWKIRHEDIFATEYHTGNPAKIIENFLAKIPKKHGIEDPVWHVKITPEMKKAAEEGQYLYSGKLEKELAKVLAETFHGTNTDGSKLSEKLVEPIEPTATGKPKPLPEEGAKKQLTPEERWEKIQKESNIKPNERYEKVKKSFEDYDKIKELSSKKPPFNTRWKKVADNWVDKSYGIKYGFTKQFGEKGYDVIVDLVRSQNADSKANGIIYKADKDIYSGLSFKQLRTLNEIIYARGEVQIGKDGSSKVIRPGKLKAADFQAFYKKTLESIGPEESKLLTERANRYFDIVQENLGQLYEEGFLSHKSYTNLMKREYIRSSLIQELDPKNEYYLGDKLISETESGITRLKKGTEIDLLEKNTRLLMHQLITRTNLRVMNNQANKSLYKIATDFPMNDLVSKTHIKGGTEVKAWGLEGAGTKTSFYIAPEIAKEWITSNRAINMDLANSLRVGLGTGMLKTLATGANMAFALKNFPRDLAYSWVSSQRFVNGKWESLWSPTMPVAMFQMGKEFASVFKDCVFRTGIYEDMLANGGTLNFLTGRGEMLNYRLDKPFTKARKAGDFLIDVLQWTGQTSELMGRLMIYSRALKQGLLPREAAYLSTDVMNFGAYGVMTQVGDIFLPYFGASIKATEGLFRAASRSPKEFAYKATQTIALGVTAYMLNQLACSVGKHNGYNEVPNYDKENNLIIPLWIPMTSSDGTKKYWAPKIPLDPGQTAFFNFGQLMAKKTMEELHPDFAQSQTEAGDYVKSMKRVLGHLSPLARTPVSPVIAAYQTYAMNVDTWTGKPVSPLAGKVEPWTEQQLVGPNPTPAFARKIGELSKPLEKNSISPIRLNKASEALLTKNNPVINLIGWFANLFGDKLPADLVDKSFTEVLLKNSMSKQFMTVSEPSASTRDTANEDRIQYATASHIFKIQSDKMIAGIMLNGKDTVSELNNFITNFSYPDGSRSGPKELNKVINHYKFMTSIKNTQFNSMWLNLHSMPSEVAGSAYYKILNKAPKRVREDIKKEASTTAALVTLINKEFIMGYGKASEGLPIGIPVEE